MIHSPALGQLSLLNRPGLEINILRACGFASFFWKVLPIGRFPPEVCFYLPQTWYQHPALSSTWLFSLHYPQGTFLLSLNVPVNQNVIQMFVSAALRGSLLLSRIVSFTVGGAKLS